MSRDNRLLAVVAVLALAAGLGAAIWLARPDPLQAGAAEALLSVTPLDLTNRPHPLAQYRGKILVVNFWATWCSSCREEIPAFIEAQAKYGANGVQFVGIALDEAEKAAAFAREFGINYPILIGGIDEAEALRNLGNPGGGLPYTLVYGRSGELREKILGSLDRARLEQLLVPLI